MNNAKAMKLNVTHSVVSDKRTITARHLLWKGLCILISSPNLWLNIVFYWSSNITRKIANNFQSEGFSTDMHANSMRGKKMRRRQKWLNVETAIFPPSCQIFCIVLCLKARLGTECVCRMFVYSWVCSCITLQIKLFSFWDGCIISWYEETGKAGRGSQGGE